MYPIAPPAKSGSREAAVAFIMMGYLTRRKGRRDVYKISIVNVEIMSVGTSLHGTEDEPGDSVGDGVHHDARYVPNDLTLKKRS